MKKRDDGGVKHMNKWPLLACLAIVILMTIPEYSVARHDQGDRVSEAPDPGTTDAKDPSTAVMDGVTVIAYVRDSYTPANGDNYRLMLKASPDYCNVNWDYLQPFYVGSGTIQNQRNPDVTLVKMCKDFDPLTEEYVAFVTWQEMNEDGHWEIWVSNVTINPSNGVISQTSSYQYPVKLSCYDPEEQRFDAMYPRINGSYMPPYEITGQEYASSTIVMVVYQQEYTENQYGIYQSHMVYDYNTKVGNPISIQWPTDDVVDNMGPDEQSNFLHPSIDTYMSQPYSVSSMLFGIVADEQYSQYYRCKFQSGSVSLSPDVSSEIIWEINDYMLLYNDLSSSPGYPDVAIRKPSSYYYPVVVWQDDNGNAYAKEIYWAPDINLGPCKSPTMRGISIDDSPRQYDYINNDDNTTKAIRQAWFNPGGFEVVWRSDTEKSGGGTYGIDSRNLELKNNALRLTHDYDYAGFDDEYSGSYNAKSIYHETTDSSDTYLTIATDNSGLGVVSFLRSDDEIMAFRWVDYA